MFDGRILLLHCILFRPLRVLWQDQKKKKSQAFHLALFECKNVQQMQLQRTSQNTVATNTKIKNEKSHNYCVVMIQTVSPSKTSILVCMPILTET